MGLLQEMECGNGPNEMWKFPAQKIPWVSPKPGLRFRHVSDVPWRPSKLAQWLEMSRVALQDRSLVVGPGIPWENWTTKLNMVIFHSFLYVYQRVNTWQIIFNQNHPWKAAIFCGRKNMVEINSPSFHWEFHPNLTLWQFDKAHSMVQLMFW